MPIQSIENGELGYSVRTKLNQVIAKLIPATLESEGLMSVADKTRLDTLTPATIGAATAQQGSLASSAVQPGDISTTISLAASAVQPGDISTTVSLAASAVQPLGLGTAATASTTDFATAAQGILADSAVQPGDISTTVSLAASAVQPGDISTTVSLAESAVQPAAIATLSRTAYKIGSSLLNPTIGIAGDSICNYMSRLDFTHSLLTWYTFTSGGKLGVNWNPANYSQGGYIVAVGGKTTAQILSEQLPQIQARPPDILILNGGTNNTYNSITDLDQAVSDLTTVATSAIIAGTKEVYLYPIIPKYTNQWVTDIYRSGHQYINMKMAAFAKITDKVFYLNPDYALTLPNNIYYTAIPETLIDGTHISAKGSYAQRYLIPLPLENSTFLTTNPSSVWSSTYVYGNVLGNYGSMWASGGSLEGVSGNSNIALDWNLTNNSGLTVVPSIVTVNNVKKQRLTISGTPTLNTGRIRFSITKTSGTYFTGANSTWDAEMQIDVSNFVNLFMPSFGFSVAGGTTYTVNGIGPDTGSTPTYNFAPTNTNVKLNMYNTTTVSATSSCTGFTLYVELNGLVGNAASGTIDISSAGIFKVT